MRVIEIQRVEQTAHGFLAHQERLVGYACGNQLHATAFQRSSGIRAGCRVHFNRKVIRHGLNES